MRIDDSSEIPKHRDKVLQFINSANKALPNKPAIIRLLKKMPLMDYNEFAAGVTNEHKKSMKQDYYSLLQELATAISPLLLDNNTTRNSSNPLYTEARDGLTNLLLVQLQSAKRKVASGSSEMPTINDYIKDPVCRALGWTIALLNNGLAKSQGNRNSWKTEKWTPPDTFDFDTLFSTGLTGVVPQTLSTPITTGVLYSAFKFEPHYDVKFATYATNAVIKSMLRLKRDYSHYRGKESPRGDYSEKDRHIAHEHNERNALVHESVMALKEAAEKCDHTRKQLFIDYVELKENEMAWLSAPDEARPKLENELKIATYQNSKGETALVPIVKILAERYQCSDQTVYNARDALVKEIIENNPDLVDELSQIGFPKIKSPPSVIAKADGIKSASPRQKS